MLLDGNDLTVWNLARVQDKLGITPPGGIPPHATTHENGGSDELNVAGLSGLLADPQTPIGHATSHQNGGGDEINVAGLSGVLADPQPPIIGAGATEAVAGNDGRLTDARTPTGPAGGVLSGTFPNPGFAVAQATQTALDALDGAFLDHSARHENGGPDEISVAGLSGLLADDQTPATHNILTKHNGFPGGTTDFLRADGTFAVPPGSGSGITQLTGDVTAGPGSGSQAATLAAGSASVLNSGTLPAGRMPALTGDVVTSAGDVATTIANDAVTFAKIQNITDARLLGRSAGSAGDMQELTVGAGLSLASGVLSGYRTLITLEADVASTASTAFQDITGLSFAVTSGTNYRWFAMIAYTTSAASIGIRVSVTTPATTHLVYHTQVGTSLTGSATASFDNAQNANDAGTVSGTSISTTAGNLLMMWGFIRPSANGTVQLRFAPETATANGVIIETGSTVEVW